MRCWPRPARRFVSPSDTVVYFIMRRHGPLGLGDDAVNNDDDDDDDD